MNQGIIAFYRGNAAYIYKMTIDFGLKFYLYEKVFSYDNGFFGTLIAGLATGVICTTVTYPLDLAHGRMAADMSKKPPAIVDKNAAS